MEPFGGRHRGEPDAALDRYQREVTRRRDEQQLPPFRSVISLLECCDPSSSPLHQIIGSIDKPHQSPATTSPNSQDMLAPSRSAAPSPVRNQQTVMPSISEGFDDIAGRFAKPDHRIHYRPQRRSERLTTSMNISPYPEVPAPYLARHSVGAQVPPLSSYKASPSLPPIRNVYIQSERSLSISDGNSTIPPFLRTNGYGRMQGNGYEVENSSYGPRRTAFYDQNPRNFSTYAPSTVNHMDSSDFLRYEQSPHEHPRTHAPVSGQYLEVDYPPPLMNGSQNSYGITGDSMDPRTKRRRGNLPKSVTDILRAWFHEHLDHPYPTEEDKQMFIARTGLSISQVLSQSLSQT